jgi:LPXTG-motif cell wall-anchored protein
MHRLAITVALIALGGLITLAPAGATPAVTTPPGAASARLAAHSYGAPVAGPRRRAAQAPAAKPHAATGPSVVVSSSCAAFCFVPARLTVAVGDTVTWVNRSGAPHNVTRCTPAACNGASGGTGTDSTFTAGDIGTASGATFRHTFTAPGTYVYFCTIHGYAIMHGTITVTAAVPTTIAVPVTPAPPPAPGPTTPPSPALANTGATSGGLVSWAIVLVMSGIAAIVLGRRRSAAAE